MLNSQVQIGQTLEEVRQTAGPELESVQKGDVTIVRYSGVSDASADYIYLKNNKVTLLSLSQIDNPQASINTLYPEIGLPQFSYIYQNPSRQENHKYTYHAWYDKGVAVVVDGFKSDDPVMRTLVFAPTDQTSLFSLWGSSKYVSVAEKTSYVVVPAATQSASPAETSTANQTATQEAQVGSTPGQTTSSAQSMPSKMLIGILLALLLMGVIGFLVWKRMFKKPVAVSSSPTSSSTAPEPPAETSSN